MADRLQQEIRPCRGGFVVFGSHSGVFWQKSVTCTSPFQDARYGPGMRLHNPQGGKNEGHYRCTVCGNGQGPCRPNP
jgi:hypothetical protein